MPVQKATKCKQLMLQEYHIVTMCTFAYRGPAICPKSKQYPEAEKSCPTAQEGYFAAENKAKNTVLHCGRQQGLGKGRKGQWTRVQPTEGGMRVTGAESGMLS